MDKKPHSTSKLTVGPECHTRKMILDGAPSETFRFMAQAEAASLEEERRRADEEDAPFFFLQVSANDENVD